MLELISLRPLIWLLAVAVLAISMRYSLVDRPRLMRLASSGLTAISIILLVLALCRPFGSDTTDELHVVFLVDVSQSVDLKQVTESLKNVDRSIGNLRPNDSWSLFAVGQGVRQFESTDSLRETLDKWQSGLADDAFRSATRLVDAMLSTRLEFPSGKGRRFVLLTDGQETDGDLDSAMQQLAEENIDVRLRRVAGLAVAEASVESITPSSGQAFYGEVMRMSIQLATNRPMQGKLRLIHKGVAIQKQDVQIAPKKQSVFHFDADMTTPGVGVWTAELVPETDHFPINNQASCMVTVHGRPRILALHEKPQEMRSFARALREQEMEIEVRGEHGLPESLDRIAAFDAIILADLSATSLTPCQMQMLKQYVIDLGGGLVMFGSENSFGLGGYYKTPVEDVLPLVSRFEKEKEKPSLAMVLVIDKSGSMQGLPIELARQAAKAAVELLGARDTIGVVGFDSQPQVICEMTSAADVDSIQSLIDSLQAGGGTFMFPAMVTAKEMLEQTPAKIRHMICLSDGRTQPADHESLTEEMSEAGITVSTVALGNADQQLMAMIAQIGRGRYYETNDPATVPQIFTKETMQATKSAIKEDLYGSVQTSDHPILVGYHDADLPFTLGYVMTEVKPTSQLLLAVETGDPLLAVGRFGLGTGMAYTSDVTEKWGGEWLAWDGCGKFWAQAIRGVVRESSVDGLIVTSRQDANDWHLDIRRTAPDGLPVNGIGWDAALIGDSGTSQPVEVREVGLGRYQVLAPLATRPTRHCGSTMPTTTRPGYSISTDPTRTNTGSGRTCRPPWPPYRAQTPNRSRPTSDPNAAAIRSLITPTSLRLRVCSAVSCCGGCRSRRFTQVGLSEAAND